MGDHALISIVDDDESIRKATKRLIQSVGLVVEDFASAEDFLSSGHPLGADLGLRSCPTAKAKK